MRKLRGEEAQENCDSCGNGAALDGRIGAHDGVGVLKQDDVRGLQHCSKYGIIVDLIHSQYTCLAAVECE